MEVPIMPRQALVGLVGGVLLLLACACAAPPAPTAAPPPPLTSPPEAAAAQPATKPATTAAEAPAAKPSFGEVRFAYPSPSMQMLPMYVASKRGFDRDEGFTAELTRSSGAIAVKAMVAGEFDFTLAPGSALVAAIQGAPIRIVLVQMDKPIYWLYAKPEIRRAQDLQGKSVGVDAIGGAHDTVTRLFLQRHGMSPDAVTLIGLGSGNIVEALIAGAVDAAVVAPPRDIQLREAGNFNNLGFLGDELPALSAGLATTEKLINERPDLVRAAARAALRGQRFVTEDPQGSIPLIAEFLNLTEQQATIARETMLPYFNREGRISPELQKRIVASEVAALQPEQEPRAEDLFVLQFVE
jgi:NitT/TauT family transport system substrate-binding protein